MDFIGPHIHSQSELIFHLAYKILNQSHFAGGWAAQHIATEIETKRQTKTVVAVATGWDRNINMAERELKLSHMVRIHCQPHTVYEQFYAFCKQKSSDNRKVRCDWLHWFPVHQKRSVPCSRAEDSGSHSNLRLSCRGRDTERGRD